ncbi:MAG: hypothetical protein ACJA1C_001107 [Crocinitomicaceae bacterium]|jgi:hypothetical protein
MKNIAITAVISIIIVSCSTSQVPIINTVQETPISEIEKTEESIEEEKIDLKTQLLGEWEFHQITIRTPKDGYLLHIAEQEMNLIKLSIANYSFNVEGSVKFPPEYIELLGLKEAKWNTTDSKELAITYYFNEDSEFNAGNTNTSETFTYEVIEISNKELTIDMQGMFIINLKAK